MATRGAELRLEGIGKRYGATVAVKPLDLVIKSGELVTLLGPSGCGKTTLLRMVAGLERPTEGRILIDGRDVTLLSPGERNVSMVFQSYALFPHMTVLDNVCYGLISSGIDGQAARERALRAMASVGLEGFGGRLPSELSGGQQQRVAVARALVLEPAVLLFDEPLSNLDARLRRHMREEIRELQQRLGVSVIYVTHDQSEAMAVSDRIVVMRNAEIAQAGAPAELYREPANAFVATFMGEANSIDGVIEGVEAGRATIAIGSMRLNLAARGLGLGPATLVIRPEAIRIAARMEAAANRVGHMEGRIQRATYMGAHYEYTIETPAGLLFAIASADAGGFAAGTEVVLGFNETGVVLVGR